MVTYNKQTKECSYIPLRHYVFGKTIESFFNKVKMRYLLNGSTNENFEIKSVIINGNTYGAIERVYDLVYKVETLGRCTTLETIAKAFIMPHPVTHKPVIKKMIYFNGGPGEEIK